MKKILYLSHHGLGDMIIKTPAMRYLIQKFGSQNVFFSVKSRNIAKFIAPRIGISENQFLIFDRKSLDWRGLVKFVWQVRGYQFFYYILPPSINQRLGKLLYFLSNSKQLIAPGSEYFLRFKHKTYKSLEFSRFFGAQDEDIRLGADSLYFFDDVTSGPQAILPESPFIVLHPGSGFIERYKRYPVEHYIAVIKELMSEFKSHLIVITSFGEEELEVTEKISREISSASLIFMHNISLDDLATVLKYGKLLISGDCGPAHLASILGTPILTVFGPTNPDVTAPFRGGAILQREDLLACMPCYGSNEYGYSGCGYNRCMQGVLPIKVVGAAVSILEG